MNALSTFFYCGGGAGDTGGTGGGALVAGADSGAPGMAPNTGAGTWGGLAPPRAPRIPAGFFRRVSGNSCVI